MRICSRRPPAIMAASIWVAVGGTSCQITSSNSTGIVGTADLAPIGPLGGADLAMPAPDLGGAPMPPPSPTDCPEGYARDLSAMGIILCKRGNDEVVRVGKGRVAFWIDRYEASVWDHADGTGKEYGVASEMFPGVSRTGQVTTPLFALSKAATPPSRLLSWFQAFQFCEASGKRLPTRREALAAARGTPAPLTASDGTGGVCKTQGTDIAGARVTGQGTHCVSDWGAQDLVGNLGEWTDEWYAGTGAYDQGWQHTDPAPVLDSYFQKNVQSVTPGQASPTPTATSEGMLQGGLAAAAVRGGSYNDGAVGVGALDLYNAPTNYFFRIGFRCVIP